MERLISRIIDAMLAEGAIEERQRAVTAYGLDLLLSTAISLTVLMAIGIVLGQGVQAICFLVPLVLFQGFGGGYHCQTHLRCWALMACGLLAALLVLQKLPEALLALGAAISAYPILAIAPVQNAKAPFSEGFGRRMHRVLVGIYAGSFALAGICLLLSGILQPSVIVAKPILSAIILSGISIFGAYWHNKASWQGGCQIRQRGEGEEDDFGGEPGDEAGH